MDRALASRCASSAAWPVLAPGLRQRLLSSAILISVTLAGGAAAAQSAPAPSESDSRAPSVIKASTAPTPSEGVSLGEVIVTAQRRSERAQSVPLAITAVDGKALQSSGVISIEGLSKSIPNLQFGGNGSDAKIFIRGVGYDSIQPGGETRVAVYNNNVYESRSQAAFATLYDIDHIEVLRGPQGTLYGRNAVAGALNIITADPGAELGGYISGQAGNYNLIQTEGAIGGPVTPWLGVRLAGQTVDHDGYGRNIGTGEPVNDHHSRGVRLTLLAKPLDNVRDRLVTDYYNERDHNSGYRFLGASFTPAEVAQVVAAGGSAAAYVPTPLGAVAKNIQDIAGYGPFNHLRAYGVSNELTVNFSDLLTLTSVSGYRHLTNQIGNDLYGGTHPVAIISIFEDSDSLTQEFRLSGDKGAFKYVAGTYYFYEDHLANSHAPFDALLFGGPDQFVEFYNAGGREKTNAYAVFGQVDVKLFSGLSLSLGLRYSHEKKDLNEFVSLDFTTPFDISMPVGPLIPTTGPALQPRQTVTYTSTDPRASLIYQFNPRVMGYVTFSQGFKSGGFNIGGAQPAFKPEKIRDYEGGLKGDFLDGRLRANVAAFYYDYTNLQVNQTVGLSVQTVNAASAKVKGVEAEFTAVPTTNLRVSLNAAWLDATYTRFRTGDPARPQLGTLNPVTGIRELDLSGNRLNYAPKYKIGASVEYTIPTTYGDFTPSAEVTWTDRLYFTPYNTALLSQPAHTNLDLSLRWVGKDPGWSGSVYVRNATDKVYLIGAGLNNPLLKYDREGQVSPPRTFGAQITRRF